MKVAQASRLCVDRQQRNARATIDPDRCEIAIELSDGRGIGAELLVGSWRQVKAGTILLGMGLMHFAAGCLCLAAGGCGPPAIDGGFDSPNPSAKLFAIQYAAEQRDLTAVPHLVEQLDSEDPAVRMMAISALQDICGETCGYNFSDPRWKRDQAVQCWVEAVQSGRFAPLTHSSPAETLAGSEKRGG